MSINHRIKEWLAVRFRSPAMHHNMEWSHNLDILYGSSTFDTDLFESQSNSVGTIYPLLYRMKLADISKCAIHCLRIFNFLS